MSHTHHAAFVSFWISAALVLTASVYVRGWVRIRRHDLDTIEVWRSASFLLGVFFIWLAMASPIAALDHELLTVHMVKHLLLMTVASPMIWLGAPIEPLVRGLPQKSAQLAVKRLFRSVPLQRLGKVLGHPAVCWFAASGVLIGWHIPVLFMLGMHSTNWHEMEQISFLASGLLFWWPVIRPGRTSSTRPEWPILLYLFLATLPCDVLSGFLVFCGRVVYPMYLLSSRPLGFSVLADQEYAGALMWTWVTVVYLIAGTFFTARLLLPDSSRQFAVVKPDLQQSTVSQTAGDSMEAI
jgi:putative membrane protein